MEPAVLAALIAAGAGLATALLSLYRQQQLGEQQGKDAIALEGFKTELEERSRREERERDARGQLDLYTEPLLEATSELNHRVHNIRQRGFLGYLDSPDAQRVEIARLSTFYRFAKYWGTVESLYGTVSLLHLERNPSTKDVAALLTEIGEAFGTDSLGPELMVWREEQRGIAELMQRGAPDGRRVIGFATFVDNYETVFARWFQNVDRDLRRPRAGDIPRLADLEESTGKLVALLEARRRESAG